jgi:hypothetical protein
MERRFEVTDRQRYESKANPVPKFRITVQELPEEVEGSAGVAPMPNIMGTSGPGGLPLITLSFIETDPREAEKYAIGTELVMTLRLK